MKNHLDLLIVEDSANDAHLISRILQKENPQLSFLLLADGQEALDYLLDKQSDQPSVLLLDLKLPRLTGLEVLERIRSTDRFRSLPVVMFSSSVSDQDLQKAYALGANSYLTKPLAYEDLKTLIRQFSEYWLTLNKQPKYD